jgi:hypothetical protein
LEVPFGPPQYVVDLHLYAAFAGGTAAHELISLLPSSDVVLEAKQLLATQHAIFCTMMDRRHYGTDHLTAFIEHAQECAAEAERLREIS